MKMLAILYRWLARLVPLLVIGYALFFICLFIGWRGAVIGAVVGWFTAGWFGLVLGLFAGSVAWSLLWAITHFMAARTSLQRQFRNVSRLSTEQLRGIVKKPTSPDLGFALMELDRRGMEERPSLESLFVLLTSSDSNRRGLGMGLLQGFYPSVFAQLPTEVSNLDAPEVWRARLAALNDGSYPDAATDRPRD